MQERPGSAFNVVRIFGRPLPSPIRLITKLESENEEASQHHHA